MGTFWGDTQESVRYTIRHKTQFEQEKERTDHFWVFWLVFIVVVLLAALSFDFLSTLYS